MDAVVREMMSITDEMAAPDAGKEDQSDADKCRLVLLAVVRAHLTVLEVCRPPLVPGLRHRQKVLAVARRGAPRQGEGYSFDNELLGS
eukprot:1601329-Pleurochrysis_carterae.AAC.5